jgi:membrane-associated protease RseP (regulator of RpoE activity)
MKKNISAKNILNSFKLGFRKMASKKNALDSAGAHVEGRLFRLWSWILPVLLGGVFSWFGMTCLEVWLDGYVRRSRPAAASIVAASGMRDSEIANMAAFLKSNPFKVTPRILPDLEEELSADSSQQITGSLAAAVLRWTMPGAGILLEDQGQQYVILVNESFDVYTLEEVTYREAIFVKDENRVVKELVYSKEGPALPQPSAPVVQTRDADLGPLVVPADPSSGSAGEINRDMINGLIENPFDELKKVRLRPADEQGLQIQWINKDSVLAQLGVQKGDVIRSINGIAFRNMMDITNSVSSLMNSDRFDVEVMRNGTPTSLQYVVR